MRPARPSYAPSSASRHAATARARAPASRGLELGSATTLASVSTRSRLNARAAPPCGSRKVVVVPNHGRLGNQIFQFAVCYAIATEHGLCASQLRTACATRSSHP